MSKNTFRVRRFVDAVKLKSDLNYSHANLSEALMNQASLFAHYGGLAADASRQVDNVKMLLENAEAQVYRELRDESTTAGTKVTENQLDKLVAQNNRVIGLKKALNEARQIESVAKTAVEAFRHRKDMLVQESALAREEYKGEVIIRKRNNSEDALAAQRDQFKKNLEGSK